MTVDAIHRLFQLGGYERVAAADTGAAADDPEARFYRALLAFGAQDFEAAATHARQASTQRPSSRVFSETATYLERVRMAGPRRVYADPHAFTAFIHGGSNVRLYRATSDALRSIYGEVSRASLLDIGVGDGTALLPALGHSISAVTLVEPSPMLASTINAVAQRGLGCDSFHGTIQAFASRAANGRRWHIAQATFSLQSLPPADRAPVLRWLRDVADRVLIVEFDVPQFSSMFAPEHFHYVIERYERGLGEYATDGASLVAQGFLIPVMCGYFDPSVTRTNHERPAADWLAELDAAGFPVTSHREIDAYWWAPAVLIDAHAA